VKSVTVRIGGIVQGVGFRPYVYRLALECGVRGYVLNDAGGVSIAAEGAGTEPFLERLRRELPPLARIDTFEIAEAEPAGYEGFEIRRSEGMGSRSVPVSPDIALCDACLKQMRDPADRRHGYWLINCTDCGPRYSIIRSVPYDRPNTSMRDFSMCPECRAEYDDPSDRRYHAQPISCHRCGPKSHYIEGSTRSEGARALMLAVAALRAGKIVAVKGLGGFHLMCDATNEAAVKRLRERKRRPGKPFAVMFPELEAIERAARISDAERRLIDSKERPVVLVQAVPGELAPSVAPGIDRLGLFLPYTPLHYRLFEQIGTPLVATSANLSDEPIVRSDRELYARLAGVADGVFTHEREILNACDDSVLQLLGERVLMLRLARGFAPLTLTLPFHTSKRILAVGANQKNAIALAFEDKIVLSPHIGDLGSLEAFEYFERTLQTFKNFYGFEPDLIVCDKHPGYETTRWAQAQGKPLIAVQHHHAHILAVLAERGMEQERVLGFAFDGTGYGDDGTIWGGEVFVCEGNRYRRRLHLRPFRLIGGEKAVREPRRAALGALFECYGLEAVLELKLPTLEAFEPSEIRMLHAAWLKGINAPVASSAGRLFDAVASLAGICQSVSYEGESGLLLEAAAAGFETVTPYPWKMDGDAIDWSPMFGTIIASGEAPGCIAARFMETLAAVMTEIAADFEGRVVLSGGVFQNVTLLSKVVRRFDAAGIDWTLPSQVSVNDGCIALGQAWYALLEARVQCEAGYASAVLQ